MYGNEIRASIVEKKVITITEKFNLNEFYSHVDEEDRYFFIDKFISVFNTDVNNIGSLIEMKNFLLNYSQFDCIKTLNDYITDFVNQSISSYLNESSIAIESFMGDDDLEDLFSFISNHAFVNDYEKFLYFNLKNILNVFITKSDESDEGFKESFQHDVVEVTITQGNSSVLNNKGFINALLEKLECSKLWKEIQLAYIYTPYDSIKKLSCIIRSPYGIKII